MRLLRWTLTVFTLAAVTLVVPAASAVADGGMTASNPSDRAVLGKAPAAVELTFSAPPDVANSHIAIVHNGSSVVAGALSRTGGTTLRQPVSIQAPGDIVVAFHVQFADGGDTSGSIRFSVGTGLPPAGPAGQPADEALAAHSHEIDPLSAILLVVDGAVALGVVLLLVLRRPRRAGVPAEGLVLEDRERSPGP